MGCHRNLIFEGDIVGYKTKGNRWCENGVDRYTSLKSAKEACSTDPNCAGVYYYCEGLSNEFWTCPSPLKELVSNCGSTLYAKGNHSKMSTSLRLQP